jgi:hydrogenase large subunit
VKATGDSVVNLPAEDRAKRRRRARLAAFRNGRTPSSATGAHYSRRIRPRCALHFVEQALSELHAGRTATWTEFQVPDEAIGCGFHEAVRGVLSHHLVIRGGKIANYTRTRRHRGTRARATRSERPARTRTPSSTRRSSKRNGRDSFKGIDIMRTVRSFDPCLPCGVHFYLGGGKELLVRHSPTFGAQVKR